MLHKTNIFLRPALLCGIICHLDKLHKAKSLFLRYSVGVGPAGYILSLLVRSSLFKLIWQLDTRIGIILAAFYAEC